MALQLLLRSLPPWSYTPYVYRLVFGLLLHHFLYIAKMLTIDSCYRHFSSSVPSKPTSISEPAGAAPYRWIENETDYRCTKSAYETHWFFFFFLFFIYTQKFGSDDAVPTQLKHLPSGCGELQCQRYKYTAAIPQSCYPLMAATGLRQTNECFRGLFTCLCVIFAAWC